MKIEKETLYFVGHEGLMQTLDAGNLNTVYIPDANLVLSLVQSDTKGMKLTGRHKHFLSVSKQAVNRSWHQNKQWIPVNPILALMELTKQNVAPDYKGYLNLHNEFFERVYGVLDVAPEWVEDTYLAALKSHANTHPSISRTIEAVYSFCPSEEKPQDSAAIAGCENFFQWIWRERDCLTLIGGPLMYVGVYAICGSPQARAFIKHSKRSSETAKNVAWDLLYWIMLETYYHQGRYENTVVCTSDHALAELLSSRVNKGPRGQVSASGEVNTVDTVDSYGDLYLAKFKRLENTKLENKIFQRLAKLLIALEISENDSIKFGFNELHRT
ncbi:MAG: hypothetical protein ACRD4G_04940 [Bryobacteraceae bacterium]